MNRPLSAACAALLLAGTLTACSTGTPDQRNGMNTYDANGTPSGTSYANQNGTQYPSGAAQDRDSYNRMTSSRRGIAPTNQERRSNGLYTAYSDGYVYPGTGAMNSQNGTGIIHDAARTARDMVTGAGNAVRKAGDAVGNAIGGINDTRAATAGEPNYTPPMGDNARNTMRNANTE